ncbi:hypothetical protein DFH09DRAFT_1082311 [Mycena vulgaris]|nr:hypothetical protein DFH09DRAFT_1082311 [Mycena vulgaris]
MAWSLGLGFEVAGAARDAIASTTASISPAASVAGLLAVLLCWRRWRRLNTDRGRTHRSELRGGGLGGAGSVIIKEAAYLGRECHPHGHSRARRGLRKLEQTADWVVAGTCYFYFGESAGTGVREIFWEGSAGRLTRVKGCGQGRRIRRARWGIYGRVTRTSARSSNFEVQVGDKQQGTCITRDERRETRAGRAIRAHGRANAGSGSGLCYDMNAGRESESESAGRLRETNAGRDQDDDCGENQDQSTRARLGGLGRTQAGDRSTRNERRGEGDSRGVLIPPASLALAIKQRREE